MSTMVALVMGAGDGLGGAIARHFAAEGHDVGANVRSRLWTAAQRMDPRARSAPLGRALVTMGQSVVASGAAVAEVART
ncbi:MAG: hypothetical protein OXT09_23875 [Myxococcales bacterium]|nr:hypothetical protein [Myxococcales bacterium]